MTRHCNRKRGQKGDGGRCPRCVPEEKRKVLQKCKNYKSDKIRKEIPAQSSKHVDSQNIKQTCSTSNSQLFLARSTLGVHCRMKYCKSYKRIIDKKTHRLTIKKKSR